MVLGKNSEPWARISSLMPFFLSDTLYLTHIGQTRHPIQEILDQTRHQNPITPPIILVFMTLASPDEPLSQLQQRKIRKSNKDGGFSPRKS